MSSVRVAVRLRPYNGRERDMNASICIGMDGPSTTITHPETKEVKPFAFDFSYWSHDGFHEGPGGELIADSDKYATQRRVFDDLGADVLKSAFEGYNSTLFAYGQTGSGKSFSMVGYGVNRGIIPMVCEEMFKAMTASANDGTGRRYQVSVTMLEIYNEAIKDLLNLKVNKPGGLKVRTKPGIGVYVEDLTPIPVRSYSDIERRMEEGTANRTVASTKMNATSSRAHTVFGISFTTITSEGGLESEVTSNMNLVDLAGSERADSTGATGDRLKEGCAINASLSALGNVISALADISGGKKKVFVPYRNSALTRLLQDALGGNSRTIMIAALSPADVNYDETLSTLRYADRAKKIKNNVVKVENPTEKMIRMLREENARLMAALQGKGIAMPTGGSNEEHANESGSSSKMEKTMKENERMIAEMRKTWEEKLKEAEAACAAASGPDESGACSAKLAAGTGLPYLINLHEDPQLSECVVYTFKKGMSRIGRADADVPQNITFSGLGISLQHAIVENSGKSITLLPVNHSKTFINGELANEEIELHTGDRIILGNNFVFRFVNPEEDASEEATAKMARPAQAWSDAMEEFQSKQGLRLQQSLGGEMDKLELEEASKRKELEEKLQQMESDLQKERELAKMALEAQRKLLLGRGELSQVEKSQLAALEDSYATKAKNVEEEITKRRELSEKMLQEQMKRKRQTKKIEEELAALMPTVNEANSMAEELHKPVRFEARLNVKDSGISLNTVEELSNLKTISISIRMMSEDNGAIWTWNTAKFESRIFMMRELYQKFQETSIIPEVSRNHDPFWDPPEAIEIGKAYVYLKALSQLVEIENEFAIVDYKGDEQGQLEVNVYPENESGEELDYIMDSQEIVGKSAVFRVEVVAAKSIPERYSNRVHVSFTFNGETRETGLNETKSTNPIFKYSTKFRMDQISEQHRQYLLKEAVVFEVKGFSDATANEQAEAFNKTDSRVSVSTPNPSQVCDQCEERPTKWACVECDHKRLCQECWILLHKNPKKKNHMQMHLDGDNQPHQASMTRLLCEQCEEEAAIVKCTDCGDKPLCETCNLLLHKAEKKKTHVRTALPGQTSAAIAPAPSVCEQCEEAASVVQCVECGNAFYCEPCNKLLHKSDKKKNHYRISITCT